MPDKTSIKLEDLDPVLQCIIMFGFAMALAAFGHIMVTGKKDEQERQKKAIIAELKGEEPVPDEHDRRAYR